MTAPPTVDRRAIDALVQVQLPHAGDRRLLLVHARYDDNVNTFVLGNAERRRVHVADQHSVLGMVEAWQRHLDEHAADDDLLVLTTSVSEEQLGWDLRAYAIGRSVRNVDRAEIVAQRFGAVDIDQRVRSEDWLIDGLLDAEPSEGWPRTGSVLTRDRAMRVLIGARLGRAAPADGTLDTGTLLEWSQSADTVRFTELAAAEREGLVRWLTDTVGAAATVLMHLVEQRRTLDAMPLGVVAGAITGPTASLEAGLALGGLLGGAPSNDLHAFTEAVEGTLERWVHEAAVTRNSEAARQRVLQVLRRADEIATSAGLTEALSGSRFVPSAFTAGMRTLAAALTSGRAADAEQTLNSVRHHVLGTLSPERLRAAEMAVRLTRWSGATEVSSVASGVAQHLADTAWVDRALTVLWHGDPGGDPVLGQAYRSVWQEVRARRDEIDGSFAQRLASWSRHASTVESGGSLLIEQVLSETIAPVAKKSAPLVIVLDGMSGAVAAGFGEQVAEKTWIEVSRHPERREAAVAAIPSVTQVSRASLLTATVTEGNQAVEKDGFAKFWRRRRRQARLFHKADIGGGAGTWLSEELVTALAEPNTVVGVVLNTIDDALDHSQEGDRVEWRLDNITHLSALLSEAKSSQRPVVLVSDHGHVLDQASDKPTPASGVESARWRTGEPDDGEVALTGPRVIYSDGALVAPWREDIRYTSKKAGYHGGASLAEMTVPVLVLLPSLELLPDGWHVLPRERSEPAWWRVQTTHPDPDPDAAPDPVKTPSKRKKPPENTESLFPTDSPADENSLGERVVASDVFQRQRVLVPRAPERPVVVAVIDALAAQPDGKSTLGAVAAAAGRAARRPEFFVRVLERLLNVDGYPIVSAVDNGMYVKLDVATLRTQFGVEKP